MKRAPFLIAIALLLVVIALIFQQRATGPTSPDPPTAPTTTAPKPIVHPPRETEFVWENLDVYQETITESDFRFLIEEVYTVGDTWREVIEIGPEAATIQTSGEPFVIRFRPEDSPAPQNLARYWRTVPLEEMHIAIDPGHIGGDFAEIEERSFGFPSDRPVREGEMTLQTAKHLKPLLEAMGARVTLVRSENKPVTPLRAKDFLDLYRDYNPGVPDGLLRPCAERRFYRRAEIVERARLINEEIQPDLLLCLHYNASNSSGDWASPSSPVFSEENHLHLLLNGAYTSGEVRDEGDRYQMLERIFQRIHERELAIGSIMADVLAQRTGLPPYSYDPNSSRALNVAGHPYLWARNLLANRSYTCPVLFFEPWVMNNEEVYRRIQAGDYEGTRNVNGRPQISIMREYAEALADGIEAFFQP